MRLFTFSVLFTFITDDVLSEVNTDCGGTIDAFRQRTGSIRYSTRINSKQSPAACTWIIDARVNQTVWIEVLDLDDDAQVRIQFESNSVILKDHGEQDEHVSFSSTGKTTVEWSWEDDVELPRELRLRFNTSEGGPDSPHVPYTHSDGDPVSPSPDGGVGVTRVPDISGFRSAPLSAGVRQGGGEAGPYDKDGSLVPQEAAHNGQEKPGEAIPDLAYAVGRSHHHAHMVSGSEKKPRAELSGRTMGAYSSDDVRAEFVTQESQPATKKMDSQGHDGIRRLVGSAPVVNDESNQLFGTTVGSTNPNRALKKKDEKGRTDLSPPSTHNDQNVPRQTRGVTLMQSASTASGRRNQPDPGTLGTTSEETERRRTDCSRRAKHTDQNVSPQTHSPVYGGGTTTMPPTSTANGGRNQPHLTTLGTTHEKSRPHRASGISNRTSVPVFRNNITTMSAASTPGTAQTPSPTLEDLNTVSTKGQSLETERRRPNPSRRATRADRNVSPQTHSPVYQGGTTTMPPTLTATGGRNQPHLTTLGTTSEKSRSLSNRSPVPVFRNDIATTSAASTPGTIETPTDATVSASSRKSSHEALRTVAVTYRGGVPVMSQASTANGGRNRPDPGTLGATSEDQSLEMERRPRATHADQNVSSRTHSPVFLGGTTTMPSTLTANGGRIGTTPEKSIPHHASGTSNRTPVPVFRNGITAMSAASTPGTVETPTDATVSASSHKSTSHETLRTAAVTYRGDVPVMSQASTTNSGTLGTPSEDQSLEMERRRRATRADQNVSSQTHSPVYRGGTTTMPPTSTANGRRNQLHPTTLGTTHETSRPVPVFRNDVSSMPADATVSASSRKSSHEALKTVAVTYRGGVPVMSPASTSNGGRIWPGLNTLANTRSEMDAGRANRSPRSTQMNQGVSFKHNQTDLPIFNLSDVSNQTRSAFYDDWGAANSTDRSPLSTVNQDVSNQTYVSVLEESDPVSSTPTAASHDQTSTSRPVLSDHDTARSLEDFDHSTATSTKETDSSELYRSTSLPSTTNPTTAHASPTSASTLPTEAYLATLSSRSPNTDDASATTLQSSSTYPFIPTTTISTLLTSGFSPRVPITTDAATSASAQDDHITTVRRAVFPLSTSVPPGTASTQATDTVPDHRLWTFETDLLTPSPSDTHSSSPTLESTRLISTAQDDASITKPSHSTSQPSTTTQWSGSTETANQNSHRLTTSVQTHILSEPPTRTTQPMQTSEGSSRSKPGTQTSLMSVTKRPSIRPGTARNDKDWAHNVRVFVLEDQPAVANVETFQVLLQVILEGNSPSYEGLVEIEPFLQRIAGYQSQHVTWHSGPAFQSVVTFRTAEAVSWLGRAESLLQKAGLRPLPAEGIFVGGVRVKNVTVGGLHGDVCAWLFSCPFGFQCVSSEGNASCRSVCHSGYCKHQGICAHRAGQPPVCQCPVGEDFWFMGQRCDLRMTRQRLAGVCFGVLAAVTALMAVLAYLAVRRFKTMLAQAKADQTQSSYRRFNHFDELSARFWQRSWPGSDDSLDNVAFSRSDELLHMRALDRPCCYHDDTLSIASTYPGSASHVKTVYPHSSQYQWDMSTCSLADCVIDSGKASDLSVCSWPIEPIQWTPFPLLQQLNQNTTTTKSSRSRSYCEGMELVDMEKSRTA